MSYQPKILALAGSTRSESYNKRLVRIAMAGAVDAGAEATFVDLRDLPLPLFDEDLEAEGVPPNAQTLKELLVAHDGILLASPEYNSSVSAVLKNAIDWASRPSPDIPRLAGFHGKVAALMSASSGALGGMRGLVHLRSILGNIGVLVLPEQVAVGGAATAFQADGSLVDQARQAAVRALGARTTDIVRKLKG